MYCSDLLRFKHSHPTVFFIYISSSIGFLCINKTIANLYDCGVFVIHCNS